MSSNNSEGLNVRHISAGGIYVIRDSDDVINCDTTNGAITLQIQDISKSGLKLNLRNVYVNDAGGKADTNNITIQASGNGKINGSTSVAINVANGSLVFCVAGNKEWLATGSGIAVSQGFITKKITLTPAQIKTLYSSPFLAVTAPGIGFAQKAVGFDVRYNYVSGGWGASGSNLIITNSISSSNSNPTYQLINNVALNNDVSTTFLTGYDDGLAANSNLIENAPLYIKFDQSDPVSLGTGTFDIYVTYQILTL